MDHSQEQNTKETASAQSPASASAVKGCLDSPKPCALRVHEPAIEVTEPTGHDGFDHAFEREGEWSGFLLGGTGTRRRTASRPCN